MPSLKQFYRTFLPSQPMMETEEKPSEQMEMSRTTNWRRPASVNTRKLSLLLVYYYQLSLSQVNIRNERTFTFTCLLLSTFTFTGEHKKREGRKPGSRLWQSDLHNKKARAQRQPSEHSCRDFATSERSDLQQKDESNVAEGKH